MQTHRPRVRLALSTLVVALVVAACSDSAADTTTTTTRPEPPPPTTTQPQAEPPPDLSSGWVRLDLSGTEDFDAVPFDVVAIEETLVAVGAGAGDRAAVFLSVTDGAGWARVEDQAAFAGAVMAAVVAGGPGLVAVGSTATGGDVTGSTLQAVVWTSADGGESWARIEDDSFGRAGMTAVATVGSGLVAVGTDGQSGVVWTSETGEEWVRIDDPGGVFAGGTPAAIAAGGPGVVVVGLDADFNGVVWTSGDGTTWLRVPEAAGIFLGSPIRDVVAAGDRLVAVGQTLRENGAAVWLSEDGARWERVPLDVEFSGAVMLKLAAGPAGLVAAGVGPLEAAAVWSSGDGIEWQQVPEDASVFGSFGFIRSITFAGSGIAAVGDDVGGMTAWRWSP